MQTDSLRLALIDLIFAYVRSADRAAFRALAKQLGRLSARLDRDGDLSLSMLPEPIQGPMWLTLSRPVGPATRFEFQTWLAALSYALETTAASDHLRASAINLSDTWLASAADGLAR